ncbi:hypothetical protein SDC9_16402 [bioreactor metagenome]|uniref:Uncharacterized protein n=1 Tax=bioreactor metagenome TaxID=1076179 RepID=A0A644TUK8_9ZZZZ
MGGTLLHADAAGGAFVVVGDRDTVHHGNTLFGALLHADFAFDATGFASLDHVGLDHIAIGTEDYGTLLAPRHKGKEFLGAFLHAHAATGAVFVVHMGQAVVAHFQGVELAYRHAVAQALATPGTGLHAAGGKLGGPAGLYTDVVALGYRQILSSLTKQHRDQIFRRRVHAHNLGHRFRGGSAAGRTLGGRRPARGHGLGVAVTTRKAATAAVGPGEGRPHLVDLGITLDMELFLEKPQGYAQHEGENGGEQHGD